MNIGEAIDILRKKRNMKKIELAKKCNLSNSYITHIIKNGKIPSLENIENICNALNIPLSCFIFISTDSNEIKNITKESKKRIDNLIMKLMVVK
ncbi:helix-turn-helix transcriptional regulator [Arsenophonus sp. aPb]|uniref:helix-turn-helix domain-containing protein n=1 Tax=Arsenophonus sp. aPb TaxID=3041619 RepID=UPI0024688D8F|nr:helix-turn-helix transcriptional regulator [Arsenophonus sp. aPb]WGL99124.1 helix-turn-helix transcriptional regulator [Arsenophonus sp. aPb]